MITLQFVLATAGYAFLAAAGAIIAFELVWYIVENKL